MSQDQEPIGAYRAHTKSGWAAYDKDGVTWEVDAQTAEELEAQRIANNAKAGKPVS